jgi:microcystin-dependent protein
MSEPFIGQIATFGFTFAPRGWANCAGQTIGINQYQALFSLIGTRFGGNGVTNFQLPDLRGRTPLGTGTYSDGTNYALGQQAGTENVTLQPGNLPVHNHALNAVYNPTLSQNTDICTGASLSQTTGGTGENRFVVPMFVSDNNPSAVLSTNSVGTTGGQPHSNLMPSLVVNFCIALTGGLFPSGH